MRPETRRWIAFGLNGLLLLAAGCGNEFAGFSPLTSIDKDYTGIWVTECARDYAGRNRGGRLMRIYDEDTFVALTRVYTSAGCKAGTEESTFTWSGTFVPGEEVMGNVDDARDLDLTIERAELALHTYDAIFDADDLGTGDDWMPGKPVDVRSYLGDACAEDADCAHAICDADSSTCAERHSAGTFGWQDLLNEHDLPELRAGDIIYDIIVIGNAAEEETGVLREVLLNGEFDVRFATELYERPIGSGDIPFVRRDETSAIDAKFPTYARGTWLADEGTAAVQERMIIDEATVEVLNQDLAGEYEVLSSFTTLEPNVYEARRLSDADALVYDIYYLYLGLTVDGMYAEISTSALTASDAQSDPLTLAP